MGTYVRAVPGWSRALLAFNNTTNGGTPEAALTIDKKGRICGTAAIGAVNNDATIFRIK